MDGYHGDCSGTFIAGKTDDDAIRLITQTRLALDNCIALCKPGVPLYAIGDEVQRIADENGYGVVPGFCGHGIGHEFHMPPQIIHAFNRMPGIMKKGMVFTIEPIFNETPYGSYIMHDDQWTILTIDGARSAQFEETIVITDDGADIMTKHKPGYFDKM